MNVDIHSEYCLLAHQFEMKVSLIFNFDLGLVSVEFNKREHLTTGANGQLSQSNVKLWTFIRNLHFENELLENVHYFFFVVLEVVTRQ